MASGIHASGGIGRSIRKIGLMKASATRLAPIARPIITPTDEATARTFRAAKGEVEFAVDADNDRRVRLDVNVGCPGFRGGAENGFKCGVHGSAGGD